MPDLETPTTEPVTIEDLPTEGLTLSSQNTHGIRGGLKITGKNTQPNNPLLTFNAKAEQNSFSLKAGTTTQEVKKDSLHLKAEMESSPKVTASLEKDENPNPINAELINTTQDEDDLLEQPPPLRTHIKELQKWFQQHHLYKYDHSRLPEDMKGISLLQPIPDLINDIFTDSSNILNKLSHSNYWDFRNHQIQQIIGTIDNNLGILERLGIQLKSQNQDQNQKIKSISYNEKTSTLELEIENKDNSTTKQTVPISLSEALEMTPGILPASFIHGMYNFCQKLGLEMEQPLSLDDLKNYFKSIREMYTDITIEPVEGSNENFQIKYPDENGIKVPIANITYPKKDTIEFDMIAGLNPKQQRKAILSIVDQSTRYRETSKNLKLEIYGFPNSPKIALIILKQSIKNGTKVTIADSTLSAWQTKAAGKPDSNFAIAIAEYQKAIQTYNHPELFKALQKELKNDTSKSYNHDTQQDTAPAKPTTKTYFEPGDSRITSKSNDPATGSQSTGDSDTATTLTTPRPH